MPFTISSCISVSSAVVKLPAAWWWELRGSMAPLTYLSPEKEKQTKKLEVIHWVTEDLDYCNEKTVSTEDWRQKC